MASNFPIYRAPSLPKLNKKNISSSVLRGASTVSAAPKLNTSRFSFLRRPTVTVEGLKQTSVTSVADALTETNRILVEIQKQLALDFASRIVEEKENLKKIRTQESKRKFLSKENAIEKIKNIGSGIYSQVDKILGPTQSIFQKIIEFFKIILTGMVVNTAFIWLSKKENREKLKAFFMFLIDHWKWIVGTLLAIKLLGVLNKIYKVAKLFKKFIDFWSEKPPGGDCGCNDKKPKGGGPSDPCAPVLNCIKDINGPTAEALADRIANTSRFKPLFGLLTTSIKRTSNTVPSVPELPTPKDPEYWTKLIGTLLTLGIIFIPKVILKGGGGGGGGAPIGLGNHGVEPASTPGDFKIPIFTPGNINPLHDPAEEHDPLSTLHRARGGTIRKFSSGGTIGGRGSGNVDSVRAMLAPGEEVIRSQSAMQFRPLLKDINDNAGRLWEKFALGVTRTQNLNQEQEDNSKKLNKTLKDFNDLTESLINKSKKGDKNAKPPANPTRPPAGPNPSAFTSNRNRSNTSNTLLTSYTRPRSSITTVNLPPTPLNKPKVNTPTRTATKEPNIPSTNPLNPWHKQSIQLMRINMEGGVLTLT